MTYLHELGYLAIASRLKNFTDILVRDVVRIYKEQNIDFEPRWFPVFYILATKGEMSLMQVAGHLNQTHPAINQVANVLEKKGLLISSRKEDDGRKRYLKLSKKGRELFEILFPLWRNIEQSAKSFFEETDPGFLETIQNLEYGLQKNSMHKRINGLLRMSYYDQINIMDYQPELKENFAKLNFEWLEEYFEVEEEDRKILLHPEIEIIQTGGHIFFARFYQQIVGTVAILKKDDLTCELTKMAVTKDFQGNQIGTKLLKTALSYARKKKYTKMILCTSPVLKKAIHLYKTYGFSFSSESQTEDFKLKRGCKHMEVKL